MNKYKTTLLITLISLTTPLIALADPMPGEFGGGDDPNPTDAPIDTNLWILLVVGCLYVGYKLYKKKRYSVDSV